MDFFGLEHEIAVLREQLGGAREITRVRLLATLAWYLRERDTREALSLIADAHDILVRTPATDASEEKCLRSRLALTRGHVHALFDEHAEAQASCAEARQGFEAAGDALGQGDVCLWSAWFSNRRGASRELQKASWADAARHYAQAGDPLRGQICAVWEALQDAYVVGPAANARWCDTITAAAQHPGVQALAEDFHHAMCFHDGRFGDAVRHLVAAHAHALASGQIDRALRITGNVGHSFENMHDLESALEWMERALADARATGWPQSIARAQGGLGTSLRDLGRLSGARDVLLEALAGLPPGHRNWAARSNDLSSVMLEIGELDEALRWSEASERSARERGWTDILASILVNRAKLLSRLGRAGDAMAAARDSLAVSRTLRQRLDESEALVMLAGLFENDASSTPRAAAGAAIRCLEEALAIQEEICGAAVAPDLLRHLSRAHEALGDATQALAFERRAFEARDAIHTKRSGDMAAAMQVRFETQRARAEAEHQRALAEAETRRADAEAAANRAKSTFLANMSHELRSPLNAMLGFSRLLLRDASLGEAARKDVAVVLSSGEQLYTLINQVLDLSKIEAGLVPLEPVACDIHSLLEGLEGMFALAVHDKGLQLSVQVAAGMPAHVEVDALKLRQVLINLLSNAVKFTSQGRVDLQVHMCEGMRLVLAVSDSGVGIAADELGSLGQPFVQARAGREAAEGTGLGLAISRRFVLLMGGELSVQSEPGRGTTVRVELPVRVLHDAAAPLPRNALQRQMPRLARGVRPRVLAVDDLPESRQLLVRLLSPMGFDVREAANGQEAIDVWQQWRPQLILMDMRMPVLDGAQATRRIRAAESGGHTVIVALTASSFEEERAEILAHGCDDFLRKPFREEQLLDMLARHLELRYEQEDAQESVTCSAEAGIDLSRLPATLRDRFRSALAQLDVQGVSQALEALRAHDAATAALIEPIIECFDYQRVSALLAAAPELR